MRAAVLLAGAGLFLASDISSAAQVAGYRPANLWGGYKEKEIRPGIWRVSASYNAASGGGAAAAATANYRAAELMKTKGFAYMRVLKHGGFELGMTIGSYQSFSGGPGYAHLTVRGAASESDLAGCEMKAVEKCATLPVDAVLEKWGRYVSKAG